MVKCKISILQDPLSNAMLPFHSSLQQVTIFPHTLFIIRFILLNFLAVKAENPLNKRKETRTKKKKLTESCRKELVLL